MIDIPMLSSNRNEAIFLDFFASFQSILIMAEWNHIDDRYSNILVLLRQGKWHRLLFGEVGDGFSPSLFIVQYVFAATRNQGKNGYRPSTSAKPFFCTKFCLQSKAVCFQ